MQIELSVLSHLSNEEITEVLEIIKAATILDDMAPLSEHVLIHLRIGSDSADEHVLARDENNNLVGYLHLDRTDVVAGPVVEIVVHPSARNKKVGTQLVEFAVRHLADARLRLWAHGELAGSYALAKKMGFTKSRELWQMRRSLLAELPKFELPAGFSFKPFEVGRDEENWLKLNAQVFAEHPEQGRLTQSDLQIRMSENWFNPLGFILAQNPAGELIGYHWTKVHGNKAKTDEKTLHGHSQLGEIYVIGTAPSVRGIGLGKSLALAGLDYLRGQGLPAALLYVDRDNLAAIKLYESIGFSHWDTDVMFQA